MPSLRSISTFAVSALGSAQVVLGVRSPIVHRSSNSTAGGQSVTCDNSASQVLSCHNTTAISDTCCFNAPGGSLLQTQFWDTDPASGPQDSWTIHGLWPDNCDGTYAQFCDDSRQYTNISAIIKADGAQTLLDYMNTYWTSNTGSAESFWEHEWGKHGTCISSFDPKCYIDYQPTDGVTEFFQDTVNLFKTLPTYTWLKEAGIVPSSSKTYTLAQLQSAVSGSGKHGNDVYFGCANSNELDEVWYFFNTKGSVQHGSFVSATPLTKSSCPATGIKYLPKGSSSSPNTTTTTATSSAPTSSAPTSSAPTSTSTAGAFAGSGYLNAITSGSKKGCIISKGTWYTTGTCATFHASTAGSGFTLSSSKGKCAIQSSELTCSSSITDATVFTHDGNTLQHDGGENTFYADSVPSGSTQGTVYTDDSGHDVELEIQWQSV